MQLLDNSGLTGLLAGSGQTGNVTLPSVSDNAGGGDFLSTLGSGAATGAALGSVVPGLGTGLGAGIGAAIAGISSLFGKAKGPDHEKADLNTIATKYDITADQASSICALEESRSPRNYDDICAQAARDDSFFKSLLAKYNAANPTQAIRTQTQVATEKAGTQYVALQQQLANTFAGTGRTSPLANVTFSQVQMNAKAQDMSISDYLTAIINGAIAGAQQGMAGAAADTPAGRAATNDTLSYLVKKYQLLVVAGIIGLIWLVVKAFGRND